MDIFYSLFMPEILPQEENECIEKEIDYYVLKYFEKFFNDNNFKINYVKKWNLIITTKIEEETNKQIISFYRIYPSNNNIVDNIAIQIKYPTYKTAGIIQEEFTKLINSDDLKELFLNTSHKAGKEHKEIRDVSDGEKVIQFLCSWIDDKEKLDDGYFVKKHKNNILWNDSLKPWRRNFKWIGFKILLKEHKTKEEYQKIISEILVENLNNLIEEKHEFKDYELNRIFVKLNEKIKKHPETRLIISPVLDKLEKMEIKKEVYVLIDEMIYFGIENKFELTDKKFSYSSIRYKNDTKQQKIFNPRPKQEHKFNQNLDFNYYFNMPDNDISISRKILYCANWLKNKHIELIKIYPELSKIKFDFNQKIFSRLFLSSADDLKLNLELNNHFAIYQSSGINLYDELSCEIGKRLFDKKINEYKIAEQQVIYNYIREMNNNCEYINNHIIARDKYDCGRYCGNCRTIFNNNTQRYENIKCYNKTQYEDYNKKVHEKQCELKKLEKCLPEDYEKAIIIYTEINYPKDLREFRNNYYHFLTLFYEKEKINQSTWDFETEITTLVKYFKKYYHWFNLDYEIIDKNNFIIVSNTKPLIKSHYYKCGLENNIKEEMVCDFGMNYEYYYMDCAYKYIKINYEKIKFPEYELKKKTLKPLLIPRMSDNLVYANQTSELVTNLEHIKYGELMVGSQIRFKNLINLLNENVLDFNDDDTLQLIKTCLFLTDISIEKQTYCNLIKFDELQELQELLNQVEYHINLIRANCEKLTHMEILILILNRILTDIKNNEIADKWVKIIHTKYFNDIKNIICEWEKIFKSNNDNKELIKISNLQILTCFHIRDKLLILKAGNYIYENEPKKDSGLTLETKEILYSYNNMTCETNVLNDYMKFKLPEVFVGEFDCNWISNGSDYYTRFNLDLYEINQQTGEFFINSNPIKTLPEEISSNPDVIRLFGNLNINSYVDKNGKYICQRNGYLIEISKLNNSKKPDVLIRQIINSNTINIIYVYIPNNVFTDLSSDLKSKYHWLKLKTTDIDDIDDLDIQDVNIEFRTNAYDDRPIYKLFNGIITNDKGEKYYDINCQKFKEIFTNLTSNINIWNNRIELYTLGKNFIADTEKNLFYAEDTKSPIVLNSNILYNVKNKIVCSNNEIYVCWTNYKNEEVLYTFDYNKQIDYIKGQNDLVSWLILAYTYGYYNYHKEAWDILQTQCFPTEDDYIENKDILDVLEKISNLSPMREFYPSHLREMEQITNYSNLFDGYKLWCYEFKNMKNVSVNDSKLFLNLRSFILNHKLHPFAKLNYTGDFVNQCIKNSTHNDKIIEVSEKYSPFKLFEWKKIDLDNNYFKYMFNNNWDMNDILKQVYLNKFNTKEITKYFYLPNEKCKFESREYYINECIGMEKYFEYRGFKDYYTSSVLQKEYWENKLFVEYLKNLQPNYDIINRIVNPVQITNYTSSSIVYDWKIPEDTSTLGRIMKSENQEYRLNQITGLKLRDNQLEIVKHLLNSTDNLTTQLNMGEGKTSMILPLMIMKIIYELKLKPVVVFKKSLYQMHSQELTHKLSLLGVKCYHFKMNRDKNLDDQKIQYLMKIKNLVIFMTPDEKKSFELKIKEKDNIIHNKFLNSRVYYIYDESDDTFHPRNQLVWVYGKNVPLEDSIIRYRIPQLLLESMKKFNYLENDEYLVNLDNELIDYSKIINYMIDEYFPRLNKMIKDEINLSILNSSISEHINNLSNIEEQSQIVKFINIMVLYIKMGLLYNCLSLRTRVNYGVDTRRKSKLSVPYLYKDIPSDKSEYAIADKTILLTYAYWYSVGIGISDLKNIWKKINKQIYESFNIDYPFESINTYVLEKEHMIFTENKKLINYWLETIVFPKYINQFPKKRCATPWNMITNSNSNNKTSGFSGTNGTKELHPDSIIQNDLEENINTNYKVDKLIKEQEYIGIWTNDNQYNILAETKTDVVIDVGSLIMENNEKFSAEWLNIRKDKKFVVFFNNNNIRVCMDREKKISLFENSNVNNIMDQCLIYMDQSHSIGTHFDMPNDFKAILTIGKNVSRDSLAQGCMRMRKLGLKEKIHHKILFVCSTNISNKIENSSDILEFCKKYTKCDNNKWSNVKKVQHQIYYDEMPLMDENLSIDSIVEVELNSEQEKELEKEIEEEKSIEKPPKVEPYRYEKHPYIDELLENSGQIEDRMKYNFTKTCIDGIFFSNDWNTVETNKYNTNTQCYDRIPKWLVVINDDFILCISMFEANLLYGKIKNLCQVDTIYSKNQKRIRHLKKPKINLLLVNLFFSSKQEEEEFCNYIGLNIKKNQWNSNNKKNILEKIIISRKHHDFYKLSHIEKLLEKLKSNFT